LPEVVGLGGLGRRGVSHISIRIDLTKACEATGVTSAATKPRIWRVHAEKIAEDIAMRVLSSAKYKQGVEQVMEEIGRTLEIYD
jgi:hypothetical protein